MKKIITIFLAILMILSLAACGGKTQLSNTDSSDIGSNAVTEGQELEETNQPVVPYEITDKDESADELMNESAEIDHEDTEEVKVLVAYFSATNTTKGIAEKLAVELGAELHEIVPENPYTDVDLNYHDNNSRTTIEMSDPDARPAISSFVENMEQYEVIFLGYPIWWGEAPRIMNTFVESYDFSGKTIIPFCTSGGSGMGNSAANLHSAANDAKWLDGRRFSGSISGDELVEWVNGLGLDFSVLQ